MGRDGVEFVEADIERMPFDDNEFDIDWLTSAGLRINFLRQSGALVHFGAVRD